MIIMERCHSSSVVPENFSEDKMKTNRVTKKRMVILTIAILLYACCLRAPFTGTGSILIMIQKDLGLSGGGAGMLTSIPLFTFGLLSIAAGLVSRRWGAGKTMIFGTVLISLGILARTFLGVSGIFFGTIVLGAGITIGNVLVPAIVKGYYPNHTSAMTSCYTTMMSVASGISGGISVPVALRYGWKAALGFWVVLSVLTMLFWIPDRRLRLQDHSETDMSVFTVKGSTCTENPLSQRTDSGMPVQREHSSELQRIVHSRLAWMVGIYMGLQSLVFYSFVSWFATILQSRGLSVSASGTCNSLYLFIGLVGSFAAPLLAELHRSKVWLGIFLGTLYAAGILIMILIPGTAGIWCTILICGFCQGACFSYSMLMFVFHTRSAAASSLMSGFGQTVGYLIAGTGPALTGWIFDVLGNWNPVLWFLFGICLVLIVLGSRIGRENYLEETG